MRGIVEEDGKNENHFKERREELHKDVKGIGVNSLRLKFNVELLIFERVFQFLSTWNLKN